MNGSPIVQLRDVSKVYRVGETAVQALRGVNLAIHPGESVAIMGPSGSGQTPLMNPLGWLVTRPRLILADEPTGNLDSRTSLEIMAIFQRLSASGITVVLVTHEPDVAAFASRVLVIRDGVMVSDQRQDALDAVPLKEVG